tara:strand:+ start:5628 stop:5849 length:222 start_codon:yes stop_codon:yes gene_type:complete
MSEEMDDLLANMGIWTPFHSLTLVASVAADLDENNKDIRDALIAVLHAMSSDMVIQFSKTHKGIVHEFPHPVN